MHVYRHDMYNVENCLMTSSSPNILLIVHISVKDETETNDNSTWCVYCCVSERLHIIEDGLPGSHQN